jgi:thymidine kinase
MVISYMYGPEGTKSSIVFNQVQFSEAYSVSLTLIRPKIYYLLNREEDPNYVRLKGKKVKVRNLILFPDHIKKKTSIYSIEKAHLYSVEDLKKILFLIDRTNSQALVMFLGLDRDHFGQVYESHNFLLSVAHYKERILTACSVCESENATFTQAVDEVGLELFIPSAEYQITYKLYEPRCESCFVFPSDT